MKKLIVITSLFLLTFIVSIQGVFASENTSRVHYGTLSFTQLSENDRGELVEQVNFSVATSEYMAFVSEIMFNYSSYMGSRDSIYSNNNNMYKYFIAPVVGYLDSNNYIELIKFDILRVASNEIITYRNGDILQSFSTSYLNNYYNNNSWAVYMYADRIDKVAYDNGFNDGFNLGYDNGYSDGHIVGEDLGFNSGYNNGYNKGLSENPNTMGFAGLLSSMFTSLGVFLSIELLPNITFGTFVLVPLVFGVILFIMGRKK